jgi:hypothetical protein
MFVGAFSFQANESEPILCGHDVTSSEIGITPENIEAGLNPGELPWCGVVCAAAAELPNMIREREIHRAGRTWYA